MREFARDLRVADFIRDELARIIHVGMRDPRVGMVSVNEVTVSKDLAYADIYISSIDTDSQVKRDELISVLNKAAGFFRSELAKRHSMRTTPKPRFHYDEIVESGPRLEKLIEAAVREDEARHVDDDSQGRRSDG
ncbi:MAG: 30S ribosome-binding factor RbfA [Gammaproteobacteria bacterium]|nr:30S ribosome-binding factor RbfA [Gammaproteobacteria bacterium]MCZ6853943.1 30S ribosome-binding factor RbfA [Gammaproteobacteria bacterium]